MKVNVPVREEATNHLIFNSLVKYESIMIPDKMTKNATPASPLFRSVNGLETTGLKRFSTDCKRKGTK